MYGYVCFVCYVCYVCVYAQLQYRQSDICFGFVLYVRYPLTPDAFTREEGRAVPEYALRINVPEKKHLTSPCSSAMATYYIRSLVHREISPSRTLYYSLPLSHCTPVVLYARTTRLGTRTGMGISTHRSGRSRARWAVSAPVGTWAGGDVIFDAFESDAVSQ